MRECQAAMRRSRERTISGTGALLATTPPRYHDPSRSKATSALYEREQLEALISVATRRAAFQTAQTLADFLADQGLVVSADELRKLTHDDLVQAIDLSEPAIPVNREPSDREPSDDRTPRDHGSRLTAHGSPTPPRRPADPPGPPAPSGPGEPGA